MDETKLAAFVAFITHPTALAMALNMVLGLVLFSVAAGMTSVEGSGKMAALFALLCVVNALGLMSLIEAVTLEAE